MKQLLSSHTALLSRRGYRLALLALVTVALLTATSTWLFPTAKAHASSSEYKVWCGSWDPNPANTTDKQIVPRTIKSYPGDGSVVEFDGGRLWFLLHKALVCRSLRLAARCPVHLWLDKATSPCRCLNHYGLSTTTLSNHRGHPVVLDTFPLLSTRPWRYRHDEAMQ